MPSPLTVSALFGVDVSSWHERMVIWRHGGKTFGSDGFVVRSKALGGVIALDAIVMAIGHMPLIRVITSPFPMAFLIGLYFLVSTIIYLLGAVLTGLGKLYKLTNYGLIAMAVIDELLLIYTREMPNVIFGHMISWSTGWYPLGTVQVFIGQLILIVLCAIQLKSK